MAKVKYKKINDKFDSIVAPDFTEDKTRKSIYANSAEIIEHYSIDVTKF